MQSMSEENIMKYPKDIDKIIWDKMVNYTKDWGYMVLYLAVFCIILMIIRDIML